jgi:regulator of RNase E activity RraA
MGDMMAARLTHRGVAGVVTDGGYRDCAAIAGTGLPCYQRQAAPPATPIALHPIALDEPVGCAGVAIYPGDVLVGDADGVAVIPAHLVAEVADAALDQVEYEEFAARHIARGRSILGLFPATAASRAEYDTWVAASRPDLPEN